MAERGGAALVAPESVPRKAQARARQYVLTSGSQRTYPTWHSVALDGDLILHHDPRLHAAAQDGAALIGSV
jgi:hypothetical protein